MNEATTGPHRVHLPWGIVPAGQKVRAVCSCGHRGAPHADRDRAVEALLSRHGSNSPRCALCGRDHHGHHWDELRDRYLEILIDPGTGDEILVCRGMPQSCRDGAAQKQLHLDRKVADGFGLELPPRLRVVRDPS